MYAAAWLIWEKTVHRCNRRGAIEKRRKSQHARTHLERTLRHGVLGGHADLLALLGNRHEAGELARLAAVDLDAVVQVLLLRNDGKFQKMYATNMRPGSKCHVRCADQKAARAYQR